MRQATVAIVGRPNVGKSTLFNRLVGGRRAIVADEPGTTRDRHFGEAEWNGRRFWLVDTGGLVPGSEEHFDQLIRRQVDYALADADLVVFLTDGRAGVHPLDHGVAERLRGLSIPVILAVNKLDEYHQRDDHLPFWELGLGEPVPVSAQAGKQSGDLLDRLVAELPPDEETHDPDAVRVAVVGRPNAGKSSVINRLLGEERHVVSPVPGTTRDAIDSPLRYAGRTLVFVDTAGLRRRAKVAEDLEFYSGVRTQRAIERADVCVLVVDAALGLHNQDLRIATEAWEQGCALIVLVNKWDLVEEKDANTARRGQELLIEKAPFLRYVPFLYVSALTGQRVRKVLDLILEVADARQARIQTSELNEVLEQLVQRQQPPQKQGDEVKLLYASQVAIAPPVIAIVSNRPDDVAESYQRYLGHGIRARWPFPGSPLILKFTARGARRVRRDDGRRPMRKADG